MPDDTWPLADGPQGGALHTDRYRDLSALASGGTSHVRRVFDGRLGCAVAMKSLRPELLEHEEAVQRFRREANLTAGMHHPGIVPVYDQGTTAAGIPWFTMREVIGRTIDRVETGPVGSRRSVGLFLRACEAVAYAHERGIVHRDLKPANLMVGSFGEVLVMDWGVARILAEAEPAPGHTRMAHGPKTSLGAVLGTPRYMSPEQARGELGAHPAATDVFALGVVLYELCTGQVLDPGTGREIWARRMRGAPVPGAMDGVPRRLREVITHALADDPADRFSDAGAIGDAVRDWLDGAHRRADALAVLAQVAPLRPEARALRARGVELRQDAAAMLVPLPRHAPAADKAPAWDLEDEAEALERDAGILELRWREGVTTALQRSPNLAEARAALADFHAEELLEAEARSDARAAARAEVLLGSYDDGRHARLLEGRCAVTLVTDPPGAEVVAVRQELRGRRRQDGERIPLGRTPFVEVDLPHGSWVLEVTHPGRVPVRYPVFLERGAAWSGIPPGGSEPFPISLPESLAPDEVYVPAGWFLAGNDPDAGDALERQWVWVDAFRIDRHPLSAGAYLAFLRSVPDSALAELLPHSDTFARTPLVVARNGVLELGVDHDHRQWRPEWPAAGMTWFAAEACARHLGGALPHELQWSKAARGVDGRRFPWGDHPEVTWACMLGHSAEAPAPTALSTHPIDCSPYGMRSCAGHVRNWCANGWHRDGPWLVDGRLGPADPRDPTGYRSARGGSWNNHPSLARAATRFAAKPDEHYSVLGFRTVRPA
ncbi:MAG: SUMF1/EgtB/PvdO family nonheme iron enzyme [Myxococcota bacterium]